MSLGENFNFFEAISVILNRPRSIQWLGISGPICLTSQLLKMFVSWESANRSDLDGAQRYLSVSLSLCYPRMMSSTLFATHLKVYPFLTLYLFPGIVLCDAVVKRRKPDYLTIQRRFTPLAGVRVGRRR